VPGATDFRAADFVSAVERRRCEHLFVTSSRADHDKAREILHWHH